MRYDYRALVLDPAMATEALTLAFEDGWELFGLKNEETCTHVFLRRPVAEDNQLPNLFALVWMSLASAWVSNLLFDLSGAVEQRMPLFAWLVNLASEFAHDVIPFVWGIYIAAIHYRPKSVMEKK